MKVSFTTKEYTRLLELVHLGLAVAGADPEDPMTMPDRYSEAAQKIFGLAENFGCADLVEQDVNGVYFPAEKLVEGPARERFEEFLEDSFWLELVLRLSHRDLNQETGKKLEIDDLSPAQQQQLEKMRDAYWQEFETDGIEHLTILKGGMG